MEESLEGYKGGQETEVGGTYTHAEGATEITEGDPGAGVARVVHCREEVWWLWRRGCGRWRRRSVPGRDRR